MGSAPTALGPASRELKVNGTGNGPRIFHVNVVVYKAKKMFLLDNVEIKKNMIIKKDITVNWAPN